DVCSSDLKASRSRGDGDGVVAGGAVGDRRCDRGGLRAAGVPGPAGDAVFSRGEAFELDGPLPPGVDVDLGGQGGLPPRAVVHADLHTPYSPVLGPTGSAADDPAPTERGAAAGDRGTGGAVCGRSA